MTRNGKLAKNSMIKSMEILADQMEALSVRMIHFKESELASHAPELKGASLMMREWVEGFTNENI
jgi:hypothetical protein